MKPTLRGVVIIGRRRLGRRPSVRLRRRTAGRFRIVVSTSVRIQNKTVSAWSLDGTCSAIGFEVTMKREREREGKKPKVIPVVLVAQEAHRESGFLFDAVMKTGQSGSVAWTHQRMTAVQSWMRQQARRKP